MTSSEHAQLLHCSQTNSALRTLMAEHEAMAAELEQAKQRAFEFESCFRDQTAEVVKVTAERDHMRPVFVAAIDWHEAPADCNWMQLTKLERACKEAK